MDSEKKPVKRPIVPIDYAGKWIAWNREGTRIIACGRTLQEAVDAAAATGGEPNPSFEKVMKADVRFVGAHR